MPKNFAETVKNIYDILQNHNPNVILYGPPGTGKTYTAKAVAYYMITNKEPDLHNDEWEQELNDYQFNPKQKDKSGKWAIVQFHPAYHYDDLIQGIEVKGGGNGNISYEKVWKILGEMSQLARENPDKPYILIIDEINRANLPAVLGELIYALEYRGEPVKTLYGDELIIPPNLYIIGTMNTADRSAGRIDYAIRRRFTFYPMHADPDKVGSDYGKKLMKAVNGFIEKNVSPDYDPEDIKIGHTYFMGNKERINYKFLYQVVPLLYEYIQDGLVKAVKEDKGYKIRLNGRDYFLRGGRLYDSNDNIVEDPKVIVQ